MTNQMGKNPDECCPEFDPRILDEKTRTWNDKLFLQDSVRQILHIPLNMGKVIARMWKQVEDAQASPDVKDFLLLAYDPSPWRSELYMTITKEIPGAKITKLSGTFLSKVFDGPYNAIPKFIKEMDKFVIAQGRKVKKYYFHYTYCPKCAKKYGHNYVVCFAELE